MNIGEICNRDVVVARRNDTVLEAARLMRQFHVGNVIVVDEHDGARVPVGIVTDRDVAIEIVAEELDAGQMRVDDIMSRDLLSAHESTSVYEAISLMRRKGVRRLPIVDDVGRLVGIASIDDFIEMVAEEIVSLSGIMPRERSTEVKVRP